MLSVYLFVYFFLLLVCVFVYMYARMDVSMYACIMNYGCVCMYMHHERILARIHKTNTQHTNKYMHK
jgi:hypothetical protein